MTASERFDRAWRLVGTASSFTLFGLGGLLLWVLFFPLLQLLVRNPKRRQLWARWVVHQSFRAFIRWMAWVGVLRYRVLGLERLSRQGLLILANHPTLIDVVFLVSLVPNADCVVKASLAQNPFTRGPIRATGYLCNDSGPGLVQDCIESLRAGNNLIIFPEGTRTRLNQPMRLQRGAANIAVRGKRDITPVTIRCEPLGLNKEAAWWQVPPRQMSFTIEAHGDLPITPLLERTKSEAVAARQLTDQLLEYFSRESVRHAGA